MLYFNHCLGTSSWERRNVWVSSSILVWIGE